MPTKPKSKTSKTKQNKIQPIRISLFWILTILVPLVGAGLLVLLAYSGILGSGATGPYAGLVTVLVARYIIYGAYGFIFIVGLLGVVYTFIKARHDWRYYTLSLALPLLLFGWLMFGVTQQQVKESNPDHQRYLLHISQCSDMFVAGVYARDTMPSETYENIDDSQLNLKDYDDRIKNLYDLSGPLWKKGGLCESEYMTEAQEAELYKYGTEHHELQKDLILLHVLNLENQGGRAACDYVRSDPDFEKTLPPVATNDSETCSPRWLSWEHGGDYIPTLDLLRSS